LLSFELSVEVAILEEGENSAESSPGTKLAVGEREVGLRREKREN
jgi:hypothetical protein